MTETSKSILTKLPCWNPDAQSKTMDVNREEALTLLENHLNRLASVIEVTLQFEASELDLARKAHSIDRIRQLANSGLISKQDIDQKANDLGGYWPSWYWPGAARFLEEGMD